MALASRSFQIFAKPAGAACNLACHYCYYLGKQGIDRETASNPAKFSRMPPQLLERYIVQHIQASPDEVIRFSWHGGEPTVLGLHYFKRIVDIQRRNCPTGRTIANGIQTNGTFLDEAWGRFLSREGFSVGLSMDGPRHLHDRHRLSRAGTPTFDQVMRGYEILLRHRVPTDILCVVGSHNVRRAGEVYDFFKQLGVAYVSFLPLVEPVGGQGVSALSVQPEDWGDFLCTVFDEWVSADVGWIKVQIIEEAARTAFAQEHSLCLFRPTCGDIPVVESNGDFYPCDHFVDREHLFGNIRDNNLADLIESDGQKAFGRAKEASLPRVCRECEVLAMCNGECPRNRFVLTTDGEPGLNYLCAGYKRFFRHVTPFVTEVAAQWRRQNA